MANQFSHPPQIRFSHPHESEAFEPYPDVFEDAQVPYSVVCSGDGRYCISVCADGLPPVNLATLSGESVWA